MPKRRRRHHPMGEHRFGRPCSQHVGVVDVRPAGHHGVDQGQHLATGQRSSDASGEVDRRVDQALETEADDQRGHQQQPGVGHQIRLVEGHLDAVDSAR